MSIIISCTQYLYSHQPIALNDFWKSAQPKNWVRYLLVARAIRGFQEHFVKLFGPYDYVFVLFLVIFLKTVYIKQLSDWVFVFIRNDQGLGTFITYLNLDSWFRISQKPHPSMQISDTYHYLAGRIE